MMAIEGDSASVGSDRADGDPRPAADPNPDRSRDFVRFAAVLGHARLVAVGPDHAFLLSPTLWPAPAPGPFDLPSEGGGAWEP